MLDGLVIPFISVALAELGDKTQLAVFCLSSQTKKHAKLLAGVILAFILADGIAILFGNFLTSITPLWIIKLASAAVFIGFGIAAILSKDSRSQSCELGSPFFSGFSIIFLSELGDKTQIASGLFATQYNMLLVFAGVIAALALLSLLAVYLGKTLSENLDKKVISVASGALFIIIGAFIGISLLL